MRHLAACVRSRQLRSARRRRAAACGPTRSSATPFQMSLTGAPGDPARGRALVHGPAVRPACSAIAGRFPRSGSRATSRRSLAGTGSRWTEGQLRLRMVDASRLNAADDHAVLLSHRWPRRVWRQPFAASRSCRRSRSRMWWRSWQRCGSSEWRNRIRSARTRTRRNFLASPAARPCAGATAVVSVRPARGDAGDDGRRDPHRRRRGRGASPARSSSTSRRWSRTAIPCR